MLEPLLHALPTAVLVVAGSAQLRFLNHAARVLMKSPHVPLFVERGIVSSSQRETKRALHRLIHAAVTGKSGGALRVRLPTTEAHRHTPEARHGVCVLVSPLAHSRTSPPEAENLALLLVSSDSQLLSTATLRALHGFTATEARLAQAIAQGQTTEEYANARGVSLATVRTQLASLRAKTGTRRQVELVALLHKTPAVFG